MRTERLFLNFGDGITSVEQWQCWGGRLLYLIGVGVQGVLVCGSVGAMLMVNEVTVLPGCC